MGVFSPWKLASVINQTLFFSSGVSVVNYLPAHPLFVEEVSTAITFLPWHHPSPLPRLSLPRADFTWLLELCQPVYRKSGQNIKYHGRGRPWSLERGRKVISFSWYLLKLVLKFKNKQRKGPKNSMPLEINCIVNYIIRNHSSTCRKQYAEALIWSCLRKVKFGFLEEWNIICVLGVFWVSIFNLWLHCKVWNACTPISSNSKSVVPDSFVFTTYILIFPQCRQSLPNIRGGSISKFQKCSSNSQVIKQIF